MMDMMVTGATRAIPMMGGLRLRFFNLEDCISQLFFHFGRNVFRQNTKQELILYEVK